MWSKFIEKLLESITGTDSYILVFAVITCILFILVIFLAHTIKKRNMRWKRKGDPDFSNWTHQFLTVSYSLFLTNVSLFPLLGMLGTVASLLTLNLSTGDMAGVRNNFFSALTSTAWGIIFSIGFKIVNAVFSDSIENQIEFSKKCSEESDDSTFSIMHR